MRSPTPLLARVRHSFRLLNRAIAEGSRRAGLTAQQQGFLLAVAARGGREVPLSDVRAELLMDQATASELLRKLAHRGLVRTAPGEDRRAIRVTLTPGGRATFRTSVAEIGAALRRADERGDLRYLRPSLREYLGFYDIGTTRSTTRRRSDEKAD
ncbi:MAG TPA: MarR family winged helix-turn-helix transcriptional regulator [Candidatus Limnocylindria bacterium]|nr:MarR family winged helix-turn-helix transcriptional regulator [Candidatus Limnocylindria bacterium]